MSELSQRKAPGDGGIHHKLYWLWSALAEEGDNESSELLEKVGRRLLSAEAVISHLRGPDAEGVYHLNQHGLEKDMKKYREVCGD